MTEPAEPVAPVVAPETDEPLSRSGGRLPPETWAEIESHYEYGTLTIKEIETRYDVSGTAIRKHILRENALGRKIVKNSKKHTLKDAAKAAAGGDIVAAEAIASPFMLKRRERIERARETLWQNDSFNQALFTKLQKEISEGKRAIKEIAADVEVLMNIAKLIGQTKKNRYEILEIEPEIDETELPHLVVTDLTQADIDEHHRHGADFDPDMDEADLIDEDDDAIVDTSASS